MTQDPSKSDYNQKAARQAFDRGVAAAAAGNLANAELCYESAIRLDPSFPQAHNNLGVLCASAGDTAKALRYFLAAFEADSAFVEGLCNAALLHFMYNQHVQAESLLRKAIELRPGHAPSFNWLGKALVNLDRRAEALEAFGRATQLDETFSEAWCNLGNLLADQDDLDGAAAAYRRALSLNSNDAAAASNLAEMLREQGQADEAMKLFDHAMNLRPDVAIYASNRNYAMHFSANYDSSRILEEHRRTSHVFTQAAENLPPLNRRRPAPRNGRRIRVGYVSPDFRWHPVGRFMLPLLRKHDHSRFEIFAYSDAAKPDAITGRLSACCDAWRETRYLDDRALAQRVVDDEIDVLVDLTMHAAGNRMGVFAQKPAAVQASYLAYVSTTAVDGIQYRLTDAYLDPPGFDRFYSERSIRLAPSYWCYDPAIAAPAPSPLPALRNGFVRFGCLNNFAKSSPEALSAWCAILKAVAGSQLLIHAKPGAHRQSLLQRFASQGVSAERITFSPLVQPEEYFKLYDGIDIALDPFPYAGGTTTCDALCMGVPVVTLAGATACGRGGVSILSNVGLLQFIARDVQHYVRLAIETAGDLSRLSQLRASLRGQLQNSPLMNESAFAGGVERAYEKMLNDAGSP